MQIQSAHIQRWWKVAEVFFVKAFGGKFVIIGICFLGGTRFIVGEVVVLDLGMIYSAFLVLWKTPFLIL